MTHRTRQYLLFFLFLLMFLGVSAGLLSAVVQLNFRRPPPRPDSQDIITTATRTDALITPHIDPSNWLTYRNKEFGFKLRYPPGWDILRSDSQLQISNLGNAITVSVLDFRSPSRNTFQAWVNERPYALIKFRNRDALRWYRRGTPPPSTDLQSNNFSGSDHFIIPVETGDWAVAIHMGMDDVRACEYCIAIFNQLVDSLVF